MPKAVVLSMRSTNSASSSSLFPVPYAVVKVDCAGGLFIEVLYHSDQVGVDVEMLHGGP